MTISVAKVTNLHDSAELPPGQVRRDAEPHRGPLLVRLARASLACGLLSLLLFLPGLGGAGLLHEAPCLLVPLPVCCAGVALAVGVEVRARRDLDLMPRGLVDARGAAETAEARGVARYGLVISLPLVLLFLVSAVLNSLAR